MGYFRSSAGFRGAPGCPCRGGRVRRPEAEVLNPTARKYSASRQGCDILTFRGVPWATAGFRCANVGASEAEIAGPIGVFAGDIRILGGGSGVGGGGGWRYPVLGPVATRGIRGLPVCPRRALGYGSAKCELCIFVAYSDLCAICLILDSAGFVPFRHPTSPSAGFRRVHVGAFGPAKRKPNTVSPGDISNLGGVCHFYPP